MRVNDQVGYNLRIICDPDHEHCAAMRQCAVVIAAPIPQPVPLLVEGKSRHKHNVRDQWVRIAGDIHTECALYERDIRRPAMKSQRQPPTLNNWHADRAGMGQHGGHRVNLCADGQKTCKRQIWQVRAEALR